MVKVVKKQENTTAKAELPENANEIFKLKIDRETQKFFIEGLDSYGKFDEVTIRPLDTLNKIVAYNDEFEVKAESTLYRELKQATDSWGGKAGDGKLCGRLLWKADTNKLSDEEKQANKEKAKFYALIFGIATVYGKKPVLIDLRVGGSKFMDVISILNKIKQDKKEYNKAELKVKAYPSEDYDWPELEFMPDFSRELPVTGLEPCLETVEAYIEKHNSDVEKKAQKHTEWKASKSTSFKRK